MLDREFWREKGGGENRLKYIGQKKKVSGKILKFPLEHISCIIFLFTYLFTQLCHITPKKNTSTHT